MISLYLRRVSRENKEYFALIHTVNKLLTPKIQITEAENSMQWFSKFGLLNRLLQKSWAGLAHAHF
jgi:hypothetical protein